MFPEQRRGPGPVGLPEPRNPLPSGLGRWLRRAVDPRLTEQVSASRRHYEVLAQPLRAGTSIAVVGVEPHAGRSTVAGLVASLLTQHNSPRVLVLDTNMRAPDLRSRLAAQDGGSWHAVLAGLGLAPAGRLEIPQGAVGFHWIRQHLARTAGPDLLAAAPSEGGLILTEQQYLAAMRKLARWYRGIVSDLPVGLNTPLASGALLRAEQILVVGTATAAGLSGLVTALQRIHQVRSLHLRGLVRCVVVQHKAETQLQLERAQLTLRVPTYGLPYDPELATPHAPRWVKLRDRTQRTLLELAASTVSGYETSTTTRPGEKSITALP